MTSIVDSMEFTHMNLFDRKKIVEILLADKVRQMPETYTKVFTPNGGCYKRHCEGTVENRTKNVVKKLVGTFGTNKLTELLRWENAGELSARVSLGLTCLSVVQSSQGYREDVLRSEAPFRNKGIINCSRVNGGRLPLLSDTN